ncbi:hypothetical protein [Allobranchiibius sp. CTAmp26]|uniref:hypothetical protein n=1 Tax=Allobranchiibius sp. CTAmp26 TaxID=2815214 RepID=UPI001AA0F3AC|nr:hypothetical protein [Allobranchiibius sp. CTAmp26]MBO1756925.1 hypothetical protein [Allobranchiibius sp. CTAmp26]
MKNFFSRPGRLSPELRQSIAEAVAQVGYRPIRRPSGALKGIRVGYQMPRSWSRPSSVMQSQLTELVRAVQTAGGLLVPFVVDVEVPGVVDVIGGTPAERADRTLGLEAWHREYAAGRTIPTYHDMIRTHGVNAFVVNDLAGDDPRLNTLRAEQVPYVALGRPQETSPRPAGSAHPYVETDNALGIAREVLLLWQRTGCRTFGHVGFAEDGSGVPAQRTLDTRVAVQGAAARAGIVAAEVPKLAVAYSHSRASSTSTLGRILEWLESHQDLDAVVCDSDHIAYLVHEAASRGGRALMLTGNDDDPIRRTVFPEAQRWMTLRGDQPSAMRAAIDLLAQIRAGQTPSHRAVPPNIIGAPGTPWDATTSID